MRPILLVLGLCLFSFALYAGFRQSPPDDHARVAPPGLNGPATRALEQTLASAQAPEPTVTAAPPAQAPRLIALSPQRQPKGARFVKAPTAADAPVTD